MFEDFTFLGLLEKGGITVIILGFFSVVSIAIMLERAWSFKRFSASLRESSEKLAGVLGSGGARSAASLCTSDPSPLSSVFLAGYEKRDKGREEVLSAMELAGRRELSRLNRFLGALGTIGSTAPFVGLFGTVLGIIRAFSDLAVAEGANPTAVADGIAEALVATATGLFVAVPAVIAYNYFVRSASRRALELESAASEVTGAILAEGSEEG